MFIWTLLCLVFISYYINFVTLVKSKDQIRDEPACIPCLVSPGYMAGLRGNAAGSILSYDRADSAQVLYCPTTEQTEHRFYTVL